MESCPAFGGCAIYQKTWMMIHADLKRWKEIDKKVCSDFCFFGDTLLAKKRISKFITV